MKEIERAIRATRVWWSPARRALSSDCWRAERLRPSPPLGQIFSPDALDDEHVFEMVDRLKEAVASVVRARENEDVGYDSDHYGHGIGRLLAFDPTATLSDGLARDETQGFFDVDNCPAWSFWVGFVDKADRAAGPAALRSGCWEVGLLAYVPEDLVALVGKGVDVNAEGCLSWLDALPADASLVGVGRQLRL